MAMHKNDETRHDSDSPIGHPIGHPVGQPIGHPVGHPITAALNSRIDSAVQGEDPTAALDERLATAPAKIARDPKSDRDAKKVKNNVRKIRMERMMSKAELARRANMSTLTIDRVERGLPCRMDTKRKILEALGLKPSDRVLVFGAGDDDEELGPGNGEG